MEQGNRKRKPLKQLTLTGDNGASTSTATPQKRSRTDENDNTEQKRAGLILSMVLKNFMCHSCLEVNFQNNVSVVIGRNGSGKSAILTALIIGLGGKATLTNRGKNIKGFVKAGRNSATIEINIYNGGPMAYRPQVYGKTITVVRHFTASGSSTYKVKSHTGELVSQQAKEITNIIIGLNIQVDNPVCILNQDVSRNFLSSNDPKHKFTLFMKATKLETLYEEYNKITANKRECSRIFENKQKNAEKMQEEMRQIKSRIDQHKTVLELKDKEQFLQKEVLWAKVRDFEDELQSLQKNMDSVQKKADTFKNKTQRREENVDKIKTNIKELEQKMRELKENLEVQGRPIKDAKKALSELNNVYNDKKVRKVTLERAIQDKRSDIANLEEELANSTENMSRVEQEKLKRIKDLQSLEEKITGMGDLLETSRNDLFQINSDLSRKEEERRNFQREIQDCDRQISNARENLQAIDRESGNNLVVYGREMPVLKQLIEKNKHRFKQEPRGPLGAYIKMKDKKWAIAAEGFLGSDLLRSFAVDNKEDNQLLVTLMRQVFTGRLPTIITSKFFFKKHNISNNIVDAPQDCISLYNALEIEDPVVSNCIVDQNAMEAILMVPSNDRAIQLMSNRNNVPRNCSQSVTIKGDRFYPDPNYKTYGSRYHQAKFLQMDSSEYKEQLKQKIEQLQQKRQGIQSQLNNFEKDHRSQGKRKTELEEKVRKLEAARKQIRSKLDSLRSTAEPEVVNVDFLETELGEIKSNIAKKQADMQNLDEEIKDIKNNIKEQEVKIKKLNLVSREMEDRLQPLEDELQENKTRLREIATSEEFDNRKITECNNDIKRIKAEIVTKQTSIQQQTTKAMDMGERPNEIRKVNEILEELGEIQRNKIQIQRGAINLEEAIASYTELRNKFKASTQVLELLRKDIGELNQAAESRKRYYKITESYFITFIKFSFAKILEYRQFKGNLNINLADKKLDLIVIPQQGSQGLTTTSNLSGGERSFSTVAFLYSLWQCMEFPFYFLDEFDVYMDKQNRTKVFDILLHHANSKPDLQFVFLTPQDISFIDKNVTVLRLADPERMNV